MTDIQPRVSWLTLERRAWLYRILTAAVPLLIAHGTINEADAALWIGLAGAVLGTGLAAAHTPTSDPRPRDALGRFIPVDDDGAISWPTLIIIVLGIIILLMATGALTIRT